jgi:hypothetical protein
MDFISLSRLFLFCSIAVFVSGSLFAAETAKPDPILAGYATAAEYDEQIAELKKLAGIKVTSLTKTLGKRDVWLITIGGEALTHKPGILLVGNVEPGHLVGGEVLVRMAKAWASAASDPKNDADRAIKKLLQQVTIYIIPRPSPDATAKNWNTPAQLPQGNAVATDDDRDGRGGEDPADDLNGDGRITMMRVADSLGTQRAHPDDPRVLIEANAKKNEAAQYRLLSEGIDNDHDDEFNEDAGGGVAFNKNWTFRYQPFAPHTGPHQVSELETRAIADWCFDHQNIAAVFTFTPEDNLFHPWKPGNDPGKIRTTITGNDAVPHEFLAEKYRNTLQAANPPAAASGRGSFSEWAYFHYGRWSFGARGWWIPQVAKTDEKPAPMKEDEAKAEAPKKQPDAEKQASKGEPKSEPKKPAAEGGKETRGADDLNALRWLARENIDGFTPWTKIKHPDFPNQTVEVGGFHPLLLLNPPAKEFDALATKHGEFVQQLAGLLPTLAIRDQEVEALGAGLYKIRLRVANTGFLATQPEMGQITRQAPPLTYEWKLPDDTVWLAGHPRGMIERLPGKSIGKEQEWLVRLPDGKPAKATFTVQAPNVGRASVSVELK